MLWGHGDETHEDFGLLASRLNENKCVVLAPPGLKYFVLVALQTNIFPTLGLILL